MNCEDCGTKLELSGTCPNCHEELFIATWQAGESDEPWSEEFSRKVEEQSAEVAARRRRWREHDIQETEFGL